MKKKYKLLVYSLIFFMSMSLNSQSIPSYIPSNGLIGWWPFSGNANDLSANGNHGIAQNGASLTSDRFGATNSAYSLDGNDDNIFVNKNYFDNGWKSFTISSWINLNSISNSNNGNFNNTIFNTNPHRGFEIAANWGNSGKYTLFVGNGTPSSSWNIFLNAKSNQNAVSSNWKHVLVVKDSINYYLYINGILDTIQRSTQIVSNYLYGSYFGNIDPNYGNEGFNGKLDDIGIWNRALSISEINKLYKACDLAYTLQPVNKTTTLGSSIQFNVLASNSAAAYQWQSNNNGIFQNISNSGQYSGVNTNTLNVTNVNSSNNNQEYRCIVSLNNSCFDTSNVSKIIISNNSNIATVINQDYIYPNPFDNKVFVKQKNYEYKKYSIIDQLGREVDKGNLNINENEIKLEFLQIGLYYIILENDNLRLPIKIVKN